MQAVMCRCICICICMLILKISQSSKLFLSSYHSSFYLLDLSFNTGVIYRLDIVNYLMSIRYKSACSSVRL